MLIATPTLAIDRTATIPALEPGAELNLVGFVDLELADLLGVTVVTASLEALAGTAPICCSPACGAPRAPTARGPRPAAHPARLDLPPHGEPLMTPLLLPPNQLHRFYAGGAAIGALRDIPQTDDHAPEDWVGSTTIAFGQARDGLSTLDDGTFLTDAIAADPEAFLGPEHTAAFGADPALLVKLLDAGERLPVHVHPDRAFAARHLNCRNGKTEAWIVVDTRGADPVVYLGFRDDVDAATLAAWVDGQASEEMLESLHRIPVKPGDTVLVPAGTPHAIGAGVFIVELQEPTDFSVLLEWRGFEIDGRTDGHLGLGFDLALQCVDRAAFDPERLEHCCTDRPRPAGAPAGVRPLLPTDADPFFRAERVRPDPTARLDQGFSILVVLNGAGELTPEAGSRVELRRGQTLLVPHAAGAAAVTGDVEVVRCRPPAPEHAPPDPGSDEQR